MLGKNIIYQTMTFVMIIKTKQNVPIHLQIVNLQQVGILKYVYKGNLIIGSSLNVFMFYNYN